MCFGTTAAVLSKSYAVERVEDARSALNTGGIQNGGVGGKKGYIYSSSCNFVVQLVLLVNAHKMAQPSSAKSKSVQKPHATLPETPVDLTGAPK